MESQFLMTHNERGLVSEEGGSRQIKQGRAVPVATVSAKALGFKDDGEHQAAKRETRTE